MKLAIKPSWAAVVLLFPTIARSSARITITSKLSHLSGVLSDSPRTPSDFGDGYLTVRELKRPRRVNWSVDFDPAEIG